MSALSTIDTGHLKAVCGGEAAPSGGMLKTVGRAAGKLAWPVTAVMAGIDGKSGYDNARAQGHGVTRSIGEGALSALNGATLGASNWALGRKE